MMRLMMLDGRFLLRDRLALLVLLAGVLACFVAVVTGDAWSSRLMEEREVVAAEAERYRMGERQAWAEAGAGDPAAAVPLPNRLVTTLQLTPPHLADFTIGRSAIEPTAASVRLSTRADMLFTRYQVENPERLMRGALDLAFVAIVIAPLLLIGLGYGVFATDRETGTARLWIAQAGSPLRLLAVRSLNRLVLVASPILAAAFFLWLLGPSDRSVAILAWCGVVLLGLLFWWSVILLVNSIPAAAETVALILVGAWALLVFVAPAMISASTSLINPPPSRFETIAAARTAEVGASRSYDDDHPELSSSSLEGRRASVERGVIVRTAVAEATAPLVIETERQFARQRALSQRLSIVSPPMLVADSLAAISGTDARNYAVQREAAAAYLERLGASLVDAALGRRPIDADSFDNLPSFLPAPAPPVPLWPILWTGLVTILAATVALLRLRRAQPF